MALQQKSVSIVHAFILNNIYVAWSNTAHARRKLDRRPAGQSSHRDAGEFGGCRLPDGVAEQSIRVKSKEPLGVVVEDVSCQIFVFFNFVCEPFLCIPSISELM